jgi:hypothetical protein
VSGKGGDIARFLEAHEERISRLELETRDEAILGIGHHRLRGGLRAVRAGGGGHPQAVFGSGRCGARPRLAAGRG